MALGLLSARNSLGMYTDQTQAIADVHRTGCDSLILPGGACRDVLGAPDVQ